MSLCIFFPCKLQFRLPFLQPVLALALSWVCPPLFARPSGGREEEETYMHVINQEIENLHVGL